jgi:hypothetical protein
VDLGARLRQAFTGLRSDYGSHRIALVLLALFYVGARRLEHLRYLSGDPLVKRFCGLARLPSRRTVGDWLRQFTQETLAPLTVLNRDLLTDALARLELPRLTIDVDGSVVSAPGLRSAGRSGASTPITGRTPATTRWLHRKAQWRLDFLAAENSMGFHAPPELARILAAHPGRDHRLRPPGPARRRPGQEMMGSGL